MVLDKHTPIKKEIVRGNKASFISKELSKAITNRSKHKNRYTKWPSRENFLAFKKQRNICKNIFQYLPILFQIQNYFKWGNGKQTILEYSQTASDVQRFSP